MPQLLTDFVGIRTLGFTGSQGAGFTGSQGIQGDIGFTGSQGTAGASGGGTDRIFYENDQTMTANYTIPAAKNAMSTGPITINPGVIMTISAGARYVVI